MNNWGYPKIGVNEMMELHEKLIREVDEKNAEYIMKDHMMESKISFLNYCMEDDNPTIRDSTISEFKEQVKEISERGLYPTNVEVGMGVTIPLYTDAIAYTVIKVSKSKKQITIQRDIATLSKDFKPEFIAGGFAGHCTNQSEQTYTYERNEDGETYVFRWSEKQQRYVYKHLRLIRGRHQFKDYNF